MKKTIIALLFMFSIMLVGCERTITTEVGPDLEGENPPEDAMGSKMEDPGETEENSTDGDS